jgi:hypothetical protein
MRFIVAFAALFAMPAAAQQCAMRETVLDQLASRYGESRVGAGLAANGGIIEIFANPDNGSWTATISGPDGQTCLLASGQAWETFSPAPVGVPG